MAVDIGPKIGIDGEKEFRQALGNINQQLRTLGSEMKAVTSAFDDNDTSQEALAAQSDVLTRQISAQEAKLAQLQKGLEAAADKYGKADTKTLKWAQAVNDATADLNKMKSQLQKTDREMGDLENSTDDAADAMDDLDGASGGLVNGLADVKAGFDMVGGVITSVISGAMDLVKSFFELADATEEYRRAQGLLNTAFEAAGYSTATAKQAYTGLYAIIGDTDTATEAAQLLAKLSDNAADMSTWINIAAGVAGTFGDALPLNSLIEAANETARVGTVTGGLADALNWASISEDDFNTALEGCTTEADRNKLIMDTLADTYDDASDAFYENNEQLVAAREKQVALDDSMADLGSAAQDLKSKIQDDFTPALAGVVEAFADVVEGANGAEERLTESIDNLIKTYEEKLPEYSEMGGKIVETIGDALVANADSLVEAGTQLEEQVKAELGELAKKLFVSVGRAMLEGIWEGVTARSQKLITQMQDEVWKLVDAAKRVLGIHSPSTVFRDEIGYNIGLGVAEGLEDSENEAVQAAADMAQAVYDTSVDWLDKQAKYQNYSLQDQLEVWRTIQSQFIQESKQYADAEEKIFDLKTQIQEEYYNKVEEINKKIADLESNYQDQLEQRAREIFSTYSIFDEVPEREEASGKQLIENLKSQIQTMEDFYAGLSELSARGVGEDLVDEIRQLGPDASAQLDALLDLSDEQLSAYAELYREKQALANEVALSELEELQTQTVAEIQRQVEELKTLYDQTAPSIGLALTDGMAAGISSGASSVTAAAIAAARDAIAAVKSELGINSPSTVFADIGENMALGLDKGWSETMADVSGRMSRAVPTGADQMGNIAAGMVNGMQTAMTGAGGSWRIEIPLIVDGREFYRATISDLRAVMRSDPEVVTGV